MFQFPYFNWTTISLGPVTIQVWGLFVAIGIALSLFILAKRGKHVGKEHVEALFDVAMWVLLAGFLGARLAHVFLYEPGFYLSNPIEIFKVWHGGLSSFGGFAGAALGFYWWSKKRKVSKKALATMLEELTFAALFGWLMARVGCSMIHDHWGIPCNCPLAVQTPDGPRLDMSVLEIIFLLPLAITFIVMRKSKRFITRILPITFVYYGILRFILDFFRATDIAGADARYFGLTPAQYFAILMVALGGYLLSKKK